MSLDDLGVRICILGPSNSGKSTLATSIGRARALPVVHLDQYRHLPNTQWEIRPDDDFAALHDATIDSERWVIEGNYSTLLPRRLERATGFILLDATPATSLTRYLRRTWSHRSRIGGLDGAEERVTWEMVRYILGAGRTNGRRYRNIFDDVGLPKVFLANRSAIESFNRQENL